MYLTSGSAWETSNSAGWTGARVSTIVGVSSTMVIISTVVVVSATVVFSAVVVVSTVVEVSISVDVGKAGVSTGGGLLGNGGGTSVTLVV